MSPLSLHRSTVYRAVLTKDAIAVADDNLSRFVGVLLSCEARPIEQTDEDIAATDGGVSRRSQRGDEFEPALIVTPAPIDAERPTLLDIRRELRIRMDHRERMNVPIRPPAKRLSAAPGSELAIDERAAAELADVR